MDLIFASSNPHKLQEVRSIIKSRKIISLFDLNDHDEVVEDGQTFRDNAYLKASYFYNKYQLATFADDSGLVVPALKGMPGVLSARYAGEDANYQKNNELLLQNMLEITNRQAYFITCICYIDNGGNAYYFEGRLDGEIIYEPKGRNGFGYDPIFLVPAFTKTLAEMTDEEKNFHSHRFFALMKFNAHIQKEGL